MGYNVSHLLFVQCLHILWRVEFVMLDEKYLLHNFRHGPEFVR